MHMQICEHTPYLKRVSYLGTTSPRQKEIEKCSRIGYKLQYDTGRGSFRGRSGLRPRVRAGMSHGAFRGRGSYVPAMAKKTRNAEGE
ncbi:hypothetical protein DPMN_023172 [Dreissena polymorpha]|uniref:Uncharacterized protein n=1 Tax=Dreissena polymorpha TaxID=45954 RepID=A0A9D4LMH7_DREPO|nr:hypothetical protein DPMN_023172 [Dreissena polymorpha]